MFFKASAVYVLSSVPNIVKMSETILLAFPFFIQMIEFNVFIYALYILIRYACLQDSKKRNESNSFLFKFCVLGLILVLRFSLVCYDRRRYDFNIILVELGEFSGTAFSYLLETHPMRLTAGESVGSYNLSESKV